ncbi:hypothetical protein [Porphyromonas pogonae]|uniref:hypothetical protein n=1 Tax=Porphyromonas pogonae TaxID=867595 RepID=UPI002E77E204|nr:hypothetical protein [Porphyromonas pogonae]
MTKRESRKQRSNWPAMQRSLFLQRYNIHPPFVKRRSIKFDLFWGVLLFNIYVVLSLLYQ